MSAKQIIEAVLLGGTVLTCWLGVIGMLRMRLPVAVKMAFAIAGATGGMAGSPSPVGGLLVFTKCTSICGGA